MGNEFIHQVFRLASIHHVYVHSVNFQTALEITQLFFHLPASLMSNFEFIFFSVFFPFSIDRSYLMFPNIKNCFGIAVSPSFFAFVCECVVNVR